MKGILPEAVLETVNNCIRAKIILWCKSLFFNIFQINNHQKMAADFSCRHRCLQKISIGYKKHDYQI